MPVDVLPGTSPITLKRFKSLGILTLGDLLNVFPNRYENYSLISPINRLQEGETATVIGTVAEFKNQYARRGITLQKAVVVDDTGKISMTWFNQPYLVRVIKEGSRIAVAGTMKRFGHSYTLEPKEYEVLKYPDAPLVHTGRIVPIYPERHGLSSKILRDKIGIVLSQFFKEEEMEFLPASVIKANSLSPEGEAYRLVHQPQSMLDASRARRRLAFDELFIMQLSAAIVKNEWKEETVGMPFVMDGTVRTGIEAFISTLPFELTGAQQRVINEVMADLSRRSPMNRFVQGDVGSGKTIIAAVAAYAAHLNRYQTLIMAPTETLATQHYATLSRLFDAHTMTVGLQTGSKKLTKAQTEEMLSHDIIVGTHALITKSVSYEKVGLVVIDEQHRFGVAQRALLKKKGMNPHLLTMTATPIPRTIALTLYGELEMSVVDEMPKGRLPIKSFLVPPEKRANAYEWIRSQIKQHGTQVFIICPLIEESEEETMKSMKAAAKEYERLKSEVFKGLKVGLLHGKMKGKEKDEVMAQFKEKKYDILVSTSVVEVGIDIPNATVMMIEGSERFGLEQLHQLRGRVGRGDRQSYCLLFTETQEPNTIAKLNFFAKTTSGIDLAEYDLKLRGPGELFGTRQSGYSELKVASYSDLELIRTTKAAVDRFMPGYSADKFPKVGERVAKYRTDQITRD